MKFNTKGIILLLILLNSSLISFSKKVSTESLGKIRLNREKTSRVQKTSSNAKSTLKSNRVSSQTKLSWDDWVDVNYLLPVAFAKGVCSQFSALKTVEYILGFILDPKGTAAEFICTNISENVSDLTFGKVLDAAKPAESTDKTEAETKLDKDIEAAQGVADDFTADKLKEFIKEAFKVSQAKEEIKESEVDICKNLPGAKYSADHVTEVVNQIDTNATADLFIIKATDAQDEKDLKDNLKLKKKDSGMISGDSFVDGRSVASDSQRDFNVEISSPFFSLKSLVNTINLDLEVEAREVYKNCLEDRLVQQILLINQEEDKKKIKTYSDGYGNSKCFIEIVKLTKWDDKSKKYIITLYATEKECENTLNSKFGAGTIKRIFTDSCKPVLKEFYTKKKEEIEDNDKKITACETQKKKDEAAKQASKPNVSLLPRLFHFIVKFLKKIAKCVVISFIAGLLTLGVKILINMIANVLTGGIIAGLKILWYGGKAVYYLRKGWVIDDDKGTDQEKKTAKREKAESYGIAAGNIIKVALSTLGVSKRRMRINNLLKRKANKN